jgi:hypothetical protein
MSLKDGEDDVPTLRERVDAVIEEDREIFDALDN